MRHPRSLSSLLLVLAALAVLAAPVTAVAGTTKKAPVAAKKAGKVDKARSAAAKKGWETRRMNQKAEANWASRIAKNPKANTPENRADFIKRSVRAQRGWQKRNPAGQTAKKKVAAQTGKKTTKAARPTGKKAARVARPTGKKTKSKPADEGTQAKQAKASAAADQSELGMIEKAGAADFRAGMAKFEEARFAAQDNRPNDAAVAQMDGHDAMAKAAFATADAYQAAGRVDEANKLIEFGNDHVAKADAIEAALDKQRGPIRRFFSWLNPFKKRGGGGGDESVRVAGE